ncbi:MAG: oligosaccharide flippase family protein [Cytophagaceae bacterium]|jgi:O-antigen/teichoic acid export membrane protein|nr:oligosaccharide flippase family protein [Cytophagaceae bacterium]
MRNFFVRLFNNNNMLSLMGSGSIAVLGFINFAILARQLSIDDFGSWIIFVSACSFFEMLRTGFLHTPLIKYLTGQGKQTSKEIIGSSWAFGWFITGTIIVITLALFFLLGDVAPNRGFYMFLQWIWLVNLLSLPFNFATWYLQSELKFGKILYIRLMSQGGFLILLLVNFYLKNELTYILYSYLLANFITSIICIWSGWTLITSIKRASKQRMKELFHFGKYSMGTMIGSNLLRTSDTLIIGSLMGPTAVAFYSVPLRLFEIIEVPLRSLVATALPTLSRLNNAGDKIGLKKFFEKATGELTIILLPFMLICFVFAEPLVMLLGGKEYIGSANILRIFTLYACFMPLDRFTGVTLDVMNVPVRNFQKVMIMLAINIGGDLLAIEYVGEVWAVAIGSILTFLTGVVFGSIFLKKMLDFSIKDILSDGYNGIMGYASSVLKRLYKA